MFSNIIKYCYNHPFFCYLILACIVLWPLSLGVYALQYDAIDVFLPWRFFGSEVIQNGDLPLWNPFQDGGYPFYADHQFSPWNPEFFIVSLFGRYNALTIQWLYIFYIALGGLGFRYLLKELGLTKQVAFFGGIFFMLSGIMIGHAQSIASILGAVWLPWALGSYIGVLKNNFKPIDTLRCITCLFLMLSAGYQAVSIMLFYVILTLGIYQLVVLIKAKEKTQIHRFLLGHTALGVILGVLLLGTIVSLVEVAPYLTRLSGLSIADTQRFIFHPKALFSLLFPLASLKQELPGMGISTLNVFSGTVSLFLLLFASKYYKQKHSPQLVILLVFGFIYGLSSLGPYTFVQPLFAQYVPGCDLFYYAVFYRFFTWLAVLILACIGLEYFLKLGKKHYTAYFFGTLIIIYGTSILVTYDAWSEISEHWTPNWHITFRAFSLKSSVLLQSLIHLFLAVAFGIIYFLTKHKKALLLLFLIAELGIISQLNIPVTVHGNSRTATLDNYLATMKSGFSLLNATENIGVSERTGLYGSIWRNQGNFTNSPALIGWTSFHLKDRDSLYKHHSALTEQLLKKPFTYVKSGNGNANVIGFAPNALKVEYANAETHDTLVVQQAVYPGWEASVNGKATKIITGDVFEQYIPISGSGEVSMRFSNDLIRVLFYLTHLGFILLLLVFMLMSWKPRQKNLPKVLAIISVLFVTVRLIQFYNSPQVKTSMALNAGDNTLIKFNTRLNNHDKELLFQAIMETDVQHIELKETALDLDIDVLAMLNHQFKHLEKVGISKTSSTLAFSDRNALVQQNLTTMDSVHIYVNNDQHFAWPKLETDMRILTAGLKVETWDSAQEVILVVEINNHGNQLSYQKYELDPINYKESGYIRKGFLLPEMTESDELKVYLWNKSAKKFTFSDFNLNFIDLPR